MPVPAFCGMVHHGMELATYAIHGLGTIRFVRPTHTSPTFYFVAGIGHAISNRSSPYDPLPWIGQLSGSPIHRCVPSASLCLVLGRNRCQPPSHWPWPPLSSPFCGCTGFIGTTISSATAKNTGSVWPIYTAWGWLGVGPLLLRIP